MSTEVETQLKIRPGKRLIVTTKLCEAMLQSKTGHEFDSSQSREYHHIFEYNDLQDPHLRDYFCRPAMRAQLIARKFITPDLKVISKVKEYNAYRRFLEDEVAKIRMGKQSEMKEIELQKEQKLLEEQYKKELRPVKKMGKFTVLDKERAQRKKEYLLKQEKKILAKRYTVELNEMKKNMQKRLELERRHLKRVKEELEKNALAEKESMKRLQHQHKEAQRKESSGKQRKLQWLLTNAEQDLSLKDHHEKCIEDFESRWVDYHKDPPQDEEEIDRKMTLVKYYEEELRSREKAIVVKKVNRKDPKEKPPKKSYLWLHLLKEQADIRDREWGEIRRYNLEGWEVVKRQWEQWKVQLRLRREAWRREHQKLLEVLLHDQSAANFARKSIVKYSKRKHETPAIGLENEILTKRPSSLGKLIQDMTPIKTTTTTADKKHRDPNYSSDVDSYKTPTSAYSTTEPSGKNLSTTASVSKNASTTLSLTEPSGKKQGSSTTIESTSKKMGSEASVKSSSNIDTGGKMLESEVSLRNPIETEVSAKTSKYSSMASMKSSTTAKRESEASVKTSRQSEASVKTSKQSEASVKTSKQSEASVKTSKQSEACVKTSKQSEASVKTSKQSEASSKTSRLESEASVKMSKQSEASINESSAKPSKLESEVSVKTASVTDQSGNHGAESELKATSYSKNVLSSTTIAESSLEKVTSKKSNIDPSASKTASKLETSYTTLSDKGESAVSATEVSKQKDTSMTEVSKQKDTSMTEDISSTATDKKPPVSKKSSGSSIFSKRSSKASSTGSGGFFRKKHSTASKPSLQSVVSDNES